MRATLLFIVGAVLVLNAGCRTTGTELIQNGLKSLESKQAAALSPQELAYTELTLGNRLDFGFDEESSVLVYGGKRYFAKGFVLPQGCSRCSVTITSFFSGTSDDPAVVYPEVWLLNSDLQRVSVLPGDKFVLREMSGLRGLQATFFIEERFNNKSSRLLIVNRFMEGSALATSQYNVSVPATIYASPVHGGIAVMSTIPMGMSKAPVAVKASPVGRMDVIAESYKPAKITQGEGKAGQEKR